MHRLPPPTGDEVRALLRLDSDAAMLVLHFAQQGRDLPAADAAASGRFRPPWSSIVPSFLHTLVWLQGLGAAFPLDLTPA